MTLSNVSVGDQHVSAHNEERAAINGLSSDVATKITKPVSPQTGDILTYNGTTWVAASIRYFYGSGNPNGTVAGPVGSRYTDYSGSNGAVEWVKAVGTGNTGWLIIAGDTGLRNISGLIDKRTSGVVNTATIRRYGNLVEFYIDLKTPTTLTSPYTLYTLPDGFRPPQDRYGALQDNVEGAAASTAVLASGAVNLLSISSAKTDQFNGSWLTSENWPSSLPGVAI